MYLVRHRLRSALWLPCALTLLVSATAFADDWDDEEESFFVEGSIYIASGYNYVVDDFPSEIGQGSKGKGTYTVGSTVKQTDGFNVLFGKRVWKYLAVETQFEYANGFFESKDLTSNSKLTVYTTTLNAKIFPFHDLLNGFNEGRLQPNLLTGMGFMATKDLGIKTSASVVFRVGGGIDYFVYERWSIYLKSAYVVPVGLLKGLRFTTTSLGLTYQFE